MVYTFACPAPCSRVIMVDAHDDDDAITKIIEAGAINCRKIKKTSCCEKVPHLPPLPEKKLREIVQLCMNLEHCCGS
ncbi:MAG: hypothetical protein HGA41_10005 [Syntrophaceae bacterium]|jgi:hypothetical protein|nr:hypothetical protein [Syntrophaceae bacterium]